MKNKLMKLFPLLLAATMPGCADTPDRSSVSLGSLEQLMNQNPELKTATLHQIKQAASPSQKMVKRALLNTTPSEDLAVDPPKNEQPEEPASVTPVLPTLDPAVAANAQRLIDEILDTYSVKDEFDAGIKVGAVIMKEQQEKLKDFMGSKGAGGLDDKFSGLDSDFDGNDRFGEKKFFNMSCEDLMSGHFAGGWVKRISQMLDSNKTQIRKTLSGCAKIQGEKFVICMKDRISLSKAVNENLTCAVKNTNDMTSLIEEKSGLNKKELEGRTEECNVLFKQCGYTPGDSNQL